MIPLNFSLSFKSDNYESGERKIWWKKRKRIALLRADIKIASRDSELKIKTWINKDFTVI